MVRCNGLTRKGDQCRNTAQPGSDRCRVHRVEVSDEALGQVLSMLRAGNYLEIAARAAGVPLEALADRLDDVNQALAEGEARNVAQVAKAATDQWAAAAWLLERAYPDRWARPANREGEKSAPPVAGPDFLDELASRRAERRSGR